MSFRKCMTRVDPTAFICSCGVREGRHHDTCSGAEAIEYPIAHDDGELGRYLLIWNVGWRLSPYGAEALAFRSVRLQSGYHVHVAEALTFRSVRLQSGYHVHYILSGQPTFHFWMPISFEWFSHQQSFCQDDYKSVPFVLCLSISLFLVQRSPLLGTRSRAKNEMSARTIEGCCVSYHRGLLRFVSPHYELLN